MPEDIVCAVKGCGERPSSARAVEVDEDGKWYCKKHANLGNKFGVPTIAFVRDRLTQTQSTNEARINFVVRELVQNADDAEASMLVLRFEDDALYVANDGETFTRIREQGRPSDFDNVIDILNRSKQDDKEKTGNFGSGFQTVFALTNLPEIHSDDTMCTLDAAREVPVWGDKPRFSPYIGGPPGRKGVLFRFPWRDDEKGEEEFDGKRPFSSENDWPRWRKRELKDRYLELKQYCRDVLLCCQHLKTIRLIWALKSQPEAFQVSRDFALDDVGGAIAERTVEESEVSEGPRWFSWDKGEKEPVTCPPCFDETKDVRTIKAWSYLVASGTVRDKDGDEIRIGKDGSGAVSIGKGPQGIKDIKKNHVHLLLPLDPPAGPEVVALLYSVIPLPMNGSNRFVFTAHFFPMSSRKDVDISGKNIEWYHACMRSIARLYKEAFPSLLQAVAKSKSPQEKNHVLLSNLPRTQLNDWMRPEIEKGAEAEWAKADSEELFAWLENQPWVIRERGTWGKPTDAHLAPRTPEKDVAESLKLVVLPEDLLAYAEKVGWLRSLCDKRKFDPDAFKSRWEEFKNHNVRWKGLRYEGRYDLPWDPEGITLTAKALEPIIRYALANEATRSEDVVPSAEGVLKPLSAFKKLPEDLRLVEDLFPKDWRIHADVEAIVASVEKSIPRLRDVYTASEVPSLIADAIKEQPTKFEHVEPTDHQTISKALVIMTTNEKLKFDRKQSVRMSYLPYRRDGELLIGELPPVEEGRTSLGESYERDWIFARKRRSLEGLPPEIEAKIKFFELSPDVPIETVEKVEKALLLVPLEANPGTPTDYARHFLSGRHGSLFVDENLTKFIGDVDQGTRERVKRTMLKAVRQYWKDVQSEADLTPAKMGDVPCIYDTEGKWAKANEFASVGGDFAKVVGYKSFDSYFADWGKTLVALDVKSEIGPQEVKDRVLKLLKNPRPSREDLATIFDAVVIQYSEEKLKTLAKELHGAAWIPVANGELADPGRALFPTKRNLSILGKGFGLFVSTGMVRPGSLEGPPPAFEESKFKALYVKTEPDIDDLLAVLSTCTRSSVKPPPSLLQDLSDRKIDALGKMKMPYYAFWWPVEEGRWRSGRIRVLKEADRILISGSSSQVLVLSEEEAGPYEHYLKWIGAVWQLLPEDLLEELKVLSGKPREWSEVTQARYRKIWQRLEIEAESIPQAASARFRAELVVRGAQSWHTPTSVLVVDGSVSASSVEFDRTLMIPPSESGEALSRLGANRLETLAKEDAIRLAWNCAGESLSLDQTEAYLSLMELGVTKRWWEAGRPLPLPAKRVGRLAWAREPKGAAIGNASIANTLKEIPLVVTEVRGRRSTAVEKQARAWGYAQLSASVVYPDLSPEGSERHALQRAIRSACSLLARYYDPEPSHIEWIDKMEVISVEGTGQRYESPWGSGTFTVPALVPLSPEQTALLMPKDQQSVDERTAALIADWAVAEGFPSDKHEAFVKNLVPAIPRIEDELNEQEEENSPAYYEMVEQLKPMYRGCQICRMTTPYKVSDDSPLLGDGSSLLDTQETVKSVVGIKGVMYQSDEPADFIIGNCLYLCPRHAKLASRQLVQFSFLDDFESRREDVLSDLAARSADVPNKVGPDGYYHVEIKVYEGKAGGPAKWSHTETLSLKPDHAIKLYEHLSSFVKKS
ncbi:MAG: hypothetical protein JRM95_01060 [Nitrososphaerota archaeon]|nr:hypothetical protein [Nitrososphaerota archaeon]